MDFEYFNIYKDEKHILIYNLRFKKCHIDSDSSKPNSGPKNNTFLFYENKKHTKIFVKIIPNLSIFCTNKQVTYYFVHPLK